MMKKNDITRTITHRPGMRFSLVKPGLALVLAFGLLVAACDETEKEATQSVPTADNIVCPRPSGHTYTITDAGWSPSNGISVHLGDTVTFLNAKSTPVTVNWSNNLFGSGSGSFQVSASCGTIAQTIQSNASCGADTVSYDDPINGTITVSGGRCGIQLATSSP